MRGSPIALISAQGEVLLVPEGVPAERLRQAQRFPCASAPTPLPSDGNWPS